MTICSIPLTYDVAVCVRPVRQRVQLQHELWRRLQEAVQQAERGRLPVLLDADVQDGVATLPGLHHAAVVAVLQVLPAQALQQQVQVPGDWQRY